MTVCGFIKADGEPCQVFIDLGASGHCALHDERAAGRKEQIAAARAARVKPEPKVLPDGEFPPAPLTLHDAELAQSWIYAAVVSGRIDARTAEAATKSLRQFQLLYEKRVIEDGLGKLKGQVKQMRKAKARAQK